MRPACWMWWMTLALAGCEQQNAELAERLNKATEKSRADAREIERLEGEVARLSASAKSAGSAAPACADEVARARLQEKIECAKKATPTAKPGCNCKPSDPLCDCL